MLPSTLPGYEPSLRSSCSSPSFSRSACAPALSPLAVAIRRALGGLVTAGFLAPAFAQNLPPTGSLPLSQVIAGVEKTQPVRVFTEVEWDDDGYWDIEFINQSNRRTSVRIDPMTGGDVVTSHPRLILVLLANLLLAPVFLTLQTVILVAAPARAFAQLNQDEIDAGLHD